MESSELLWSAALLRLNVSRASPTSEHLNVLVATLDNAPDLAIVFHVFRRADRANREDTVRGLVEQVLAQSGRSRCLFISRMIEAWDKNQYDAIGLARAFDS
jgi:hypothetical protein